MTTRPRKDGRLTVRVESTDKADIAAIMEAEGRSESDVTRILIREGIAARKAKGKGLVAS